MNRMMKRLSVVTLALFGLAVAFAPAGAAPVERGDKKPVEKAQTVHIALCLDVSGSMQGLINSAKTKLWDIVNDLGKIKPVPNLRVALYSYGHSTYEAKAGWVRKEVDLTSDLDIVYQKLNSLTIKGGNEYVARVCRDAIVDQKWSEDKNALKLIFVAGNESAAQDPAVTLKEVAEKAKDQDIIINPIYCGRADHRDSAAWKELASLSNGKFANIDHDNGIVAIATPMDKELAELSGKLNTTYLAYGKDGKEAMKNQAEQDSNAQRLGGAAAAPRALAKASGIYRSDAWDIIDRMKNDKSFDIKKLKDEELCDELKKLKPEEREAFIKKKAQEREDIQKQIAELSKKRDSYVKEEMKKQNIKNNGAFDEAIRRAIQEQAKQKGINIPID